METVQGGASGFDPAVDFDEFIRRVRGGDAAAAEQLVRYYEPEIRVEVRHWLRLRDPRLRRVFDSMDICQSVMADFFACSARGDFDIGDPSRLVRLLIGMASNKLAERARYHHRAKRDVRAVVPLEAAGADARPGGETPSRIASARDLLARCRGLLDDAERRMVDMRGRGEGWSAIATELGGTPEARRKQFARALDRVARAMGGNPTSP